MCAPLSPFEPLSCLTALYDCKLFNPPWSVSGQPLTLFPSDMEWRTSLFWAYLSSDSVMHSIGGSWDIDLKNTHCQLIVYWTKQFKPSTDSTHIESKTELKTVRGSAVTSVLWMVIMETASDLHTDMHLNGHVINLKKISKLHSQQISKVVGNFHLCLYVCLFSYIPTRNLWRTRTDEHIVSCSLHQMPVNS